MAANSPSSPPYIDCAAKGIVYIPSRGSLCHTTRIPGRLYAGTIAHVSVSNPVPVGSTIYGYVHTHIFILGIYIKCTRRR